MRGKRVQGSVRRAKRQRLEKPLECPVRWVVERVWWWVWGGSVWVGCGVWRVRFCVGLWAVCVACVCVCGKCGVQAVGVVCWVGRVVCEGWVIRR